MSMLATSIEKIYAIHSYSDSEFFIFIITYMSF